MITSIIQQTNSISPAYICSTSTYRLIHWVSLQYQEIYIEVNQMTGKKKDGKETETQTYPTPGGKEKETHIR